MPKLLKMLIGLLLLVTTIGLATCQSALKAEPWVLPITLDHDEIQKK